MTESLFNSIHGIGPKRLKLLFQEFSTIKSIAVSNVVLVSERVHIPEEIAENVIKTARSFVNKN